MAHRVPTRKTSCILGTSPSLHQVQARRTAIQLSVVLIKITHTLDMGHEKPPYLTLGISNDPMFRNFSKYPVSRVCFNPNCIITFWFHFSPSTESVYTLWFLTDSDPGSIPPHCIYLLESVSLNPHSTSLVRVITYLYYFYSRYPLFCLNHTIASLRLGAQ